MSCVFEDHLACGIGGHNPVGEMLTVSDVVTDSRSAVGLVKGHVVSLVLMSRQGV